jgi:predicted nucleic acid-binding protein
MNTDPKDIGWSIPHYIDASAAVKLVVAEEGSARLEEYIKYWSHHSYITEFAFYETLSVLKKKRRQKEIDEKTYHAAVPGLVAYLDENLLQIDSEFRLDNYKVIFEVGELVKKYSLDYSDALQIYTVLKGKWSGKRFECTTVFVTADSDLAKAARQEGLRVWNLSKEANPPDWDDSKKGRELAS